MLSADIVSTKEIHLNQLNLKTVVLPGNRKIAEVVIKKRLDDSKEGRHFIDLRIVLVGALGAGKSTLLGHLCHGAKDNGRGKARLNLLRHRHELESGRSSSISHEIIGYDFEGSLVNYASTNVSTWEQICEYSHKIVTFLDTCGFPKYLRTTMSGLMGYAPDYACLTIAGNSGTVSGMTKEHLSIAVMLEIPIFVVITKSDIASQSQLTSTLCSFLSILNSPWINKVPVVVRTEKELNSCAIGLSRKGHELPIFMVSNVTGSNMNLLLKFIHRLPQPIRKGFEELLEESLEFQIEDVYSLPEVGVVIGGVLVQGRINVKDNRCYYLGPSHEGKFIEVKVKSIHRNRIPANYVHCGQTAALALEEVNPSDWKIHKGMVLLETNNPNCVFEFEVDIMVFFHENGVYTGTRGMVHSGSIQQHAQVLPLSVNKEDIRIPSGYRGKCVLKFIHEPCYLRIGSRVLFMEGSSKCIGKITRFLHS
ncbi:P-loop containing nucleoside triphosphate hydrolase protein [Sporodiniella umbellata]|nr:P-loop containing nucleoside triphosphate hydrolase protein [Sporodiniella umbellata]